MNVILWDWDNTLADTIKPLKEAFNATFRHYKMPTITLEQMKSYMNSSSTQLFEDLFPNFNLNEVKQVYLKYYQENVSNLHLLPGAKEILKWTKRKGFANILASNKHYLILRQEAELSGLIDYFKEICGAEQFQENKPSKIFTDAALEKFKNYDKLFVIGDGVSDVLMARNYSDAKAILVGTDPKTREFENNQPDFSVENLSGVTDILSQQLS